MSFDQRLAILQGDYNMLKKQVDHIYKVLNSVDNYGETIMNAAAFVKDQKQFQENINAMINAYQSETRKTIEGLKADIYILKTRRAAQSNNTNTRNNNNTKSVHSNTSAFTNPEYKVFGNSYNRENVKNTQLKMITSGGKRKTRNTRKTPKRKSKKTTKRR